VIQVSPSTDLPQKRVLVVDDSKFVRTTFASILSASFAVREAADGEAAWQALESDPSIVMVFTDLDMPKLNGFGLLVRIRESKDARIRELPVVVISGNEEQGNKQRARELGANDFIGKSADAPEVLSRLDNVLRLVRTRRDLEVSREALDRTATHDPLTGTFTPHYLVTEGRKYFAHARRHRGELSVMALRLDSHDEIARTAGKDVAALVIQRIAKLVMERVRAEDSVARVAQATFMVVAAGTAAAQMVALSQRLRGELDEAKVTFRRQVLRFSTSFGIATLGVDPANSIEELMRLALQRLQTVPNAPAAPKPAGLPGEIERALRVLEKADAARLGAAAGEVLGRLKRIAKRYTRER
jgi:two-component system cell cycle response regulator